MDRIAGDPRCLAGVLKPALLSLLMRAVVAQSAVIAALAAEELREQAPIVPEDDRWLTVDEAAVMLRRARQWIYRNKRRLPFVKPISGRSLLCSEVGIRRWLASRKA